MKKTAITNLWPQRDPITNRLVCMNCWNGVHYRLNALTGKPTMESNCNNPDCDCIHLSESQAAADERAKRLANSRAKKKLMREALESPDNPLRAVNPKHLSFMR